MRARTVAVALVAVLVAPGAAQARVRAHGLTRAGLALQHGHVRALVAASVASCPAGVPVQMITVRNQAHVRRFALAKVENAVVAQSLQLRVAWGTPCVQFAPGGWKVYLKIGGAEPHGEHDFYGQPYALVWTSGASVEGWSRDFSHEVIEMLEDPTLNVRYSHEGSTWQREIADPVEGLGYRLNGVYVADFVTPQWYAGASTGVDVLCQSPMCIDNSPLIAQADAPGPYDQMAVLTAPWQTDPASVVGTESPRAIR